MTPIKINDDLTVFAEMIVGVQVLPADIVTEHSRTHSRYDAEVQLVLVMGQQLTVAKFNPQDLHRYTFDHAAAVAEANTAARKLADEIVAKLGQTTVRTLEQ